MEVLKKGSKGELVGEWQEFLKVLDLYTYAVDDDFGNLTHNATIKFQKLNGLVDDGVVGRNTWNKAYELGFATTDESEIENDLFVTAWMPTHEYRKSDKNKRWIFGHHTAGWNNPFKTIRNWANDKRGQVATEFCVGGQKITNNDTEYDGVIVQAFPEGNYGWHLSIGNNDMHRNSVGVELNNFGYVTEGGYYKRINNKKTFIEKDKNSFYTYVGTEAHPDQLVTLKKEFRGFKKWHRYSDEQLKQFERLIKHIGERDSIDYRKGLPQLIRQKGADAFDICDVEMCKKTHGLWVHSNVRKTKVDMFPQEELIDMFLSL